MTFAVVGNLVTATYGFTWLGVGEEPALFYIVDALDLKGRQQTTARDAFVQVEMPSSRPSTLSPVMGEGEGTRSAGPGVGRAGCRSLHV